jgi:hypothetical protein
MATREVAFLKPEVKLNEAQVAEIEEHLKATTYLKVADIIARAIECI